MAEINPSLKKIAIVTELDAPLRRHYELVAGIQEYAAAHENWDLEVSLFPEVQMESGVHFDGIVGRIEPVTYAAAKRLGIPIVNVMCASPVRDNLPACLIDVYEAGIMAADHLLNRGMPRLLSVQLKGQRLTQLYSEAMLQQANPHDIPVRVTTLPADPGATRENWRITREKLAKAIEGWRPPVGIVTHTDVSARLIITLLSDLGWRTPDNFALVSMGNEETICTSIHPTISSIDFGYHRNGYEAAAMLAKLMRGEELSNKPVLVPPKALVARGSSDVFAVRDPEVQKALRFMADNCDHMVGVPEITAATGIGRQTLERRFRKELNTSIYNSLHRLRIERAKRLLVEDRHLPIKHLSLQTGFATMSSFYAAFRKQTGMSPAAYRKTYADPTDW